MKTTTWGHNSNLDARTWRREIIWSAAVIAAALIAVWQFAL